MSDKLLLQALIRNKEAEQIISKRLHTPFNSFSSQQRFLPGHKRQSVNIAQYGVIFVIQQI
jgi:hypothetical protein